MNQNIPRISVGLPVFNGENYLEEALSSILVQTYQDFEIIISDNASTDKTAEICRAYADKDSRIRYFRNKENRGGADNFNRVFELASGEYFKWAAHDDLCAPEFLEQCIEVLDREANVVLCYPRTILINEHGEFQGYYADGLELRSPKPHERFRHFFDTQGVCHAIYGVMRSSALRLTRLEGYFSMADRVLLGELVLHGEFRELPAYLFYRRIHPLISTASMSDRELAGWYDLRKKGKIVLPKWRRLVEYFRSINRAPLSWSQRLRCCLEIVRFALYPRRWAGLGEDLFGALTMTLSKLLAQGRGPTKSG